MSEILAENYNFSKIGKYISNKLHHIHKPKREAVKIATSSSPTTHQALHLSHRRAQNKENRLKKRVEWVEPTVGSYQVNYSAVDKNISNMNFNRSTPHFFGVKYHSNEATPCQHDFPDAPPSKQKGLTQIGRMTGRDQIRGYVRKNIENPHQSRFQIKKMPVLTARTGSGVSFSKMSPRKQWGNQGIPLPDYDCNYQVSMCRLDSHILPFQRQTSRYQSLPKTVPLEDYRTGQHERTLVDKTVAWSKQLPRQVQGVLPSYMDKSISSRMAVSLANLKALEMNCSDIRLPQKKLAKRKIGEASKRFAIEQTL